MYKKVRIICEPFFIKTETEKKFQKNEKKCLTNKKRYDIL